VTRRAPSAHRVTSSRAAALVAFLAILAAAFVVSACVAAAVSAATNPSTAEIRTKLRDAAVVRGIPPKILYGIAYQESRWLQFNASGTPLMSRDGGIGIMQVTSYGGYNVDRLKTDIDYNIAAGADILIVKWGYAPRVFPRIGDGDSRCYENWFFAVWAYNGWVANNQYPYKVWGHVAAGPEGWWTGVPVTPVPASSLVRGFPATVVPTPQPAHYWGVNPLPKPELGTPRARARVGAGKRFYVTGTLSPRYPAGETTVQIRAYRHNGSRWVLRRTILAKNRDFGDSTKYVARFALGKTGRWRLRADVPADAEHAAASSSPRYVTVR
jgi:hypothetical protein